MAGAVDFPCGSAKVDMDRIDQQIEQALAALTPTHLEITDESHLHSRGLQTHYKAVVVSDAFAGLRPVQRHQRVYAALGELMPRFHALALHTYTPQEWSEQAAAPDSPRCLGGSRFDKAAPG